MSKLNLGFGSTTRVAGVSEAIENATRELTETLDQLVEEIEAKNAELAALRSRPLTRSSMQSVVKSCVDDLKPLAAVTPALLEHGRTDAVQAQLRGLGAVELFALIAPDMIEAYLMRRLDMSAEDRGGWPSDQERENEIEKEQEIELQLAELQEALRSARRTAWKAGITSIPGHEKPRPAPPPGPSVTGPGSRL